MSILPAAGESYTIRRKVFKIFGASFHIYGKDGALAGFCNQKAFKLREDIRIFTDESCTTELIRIAARQVIDFGATYDVFLASGQQLGSLRRKGLKSTFIRDEWLILDPAGAEIGLVQENGSFLSILRRVGDDWAFLLPQRYTITDKSGRVAGRLRQHFNPFIFRLGVTVTDDAEAAGMDDLFILAIGCVVAAIEGRQT